MNLISIFTLSILSGNIVLNKFLGICPFVGTTKKEKTAIGMGISVSIILLLSTSLTYLVYKYVLVPTETTYLRTMMFILIIASLVQITEIILKKYFKNLYKELGIYLPLITTNCAVLGVCLLAINNNYTFLEALFFALGSSIGFTLVSYIFATIRERLDNAPMIKSMKGYPIAFITACIMALIFARYLI